MKARFGCRSSVASLLQSLKVKSEQPQVNTLAGSKSEEWLAEKADRRLYPSHALKISSAAYVLDGQKLGTAWRRLQHGLLALSGCSESRRD